MKKLFLKKVILTCTRAAFCSALIPSASTLFRIAAVALASLYSKSPAWSFLISAELAVA